MSKLGIRSDEFNRVHVVSVLWMRKIETDHTQP